MRTLTFLLALSLAGCDRPGGAENAAGSTEAPAAAPASSAPAAEPGAQPSPPPPAVPDAPGVIPAAFEGVYDQSPADCAEPSEYRLQVTPDSLRFHESISEVRGVTIEGPDAVSVTAAFQGEGESWQAVRRLELSDGGGTITITGDGTSLSRVRCP